jgi:dihydrofolate reductase
MKASVNIALSVDGFIATNDGGVDWLNEQPTIEGEDHGFQAFLDSVDVLIMGRKSFEKVLSFGEDAWAYGDKRIVVMSRHPFEIPQHVKKSVSASSLEPTALCAELETLGFQHAYIDGGYTIRQFLKAGLIDRIHLTTVPLILGEGIPLFSDQGRIELSHVCTKYWSNGMVQSIYDVVY